MGRPYTKGRDPLWKALAPVPDGAAAFTLTQQVHAELYRRIICLDLAPGQRLHADVIAVELGVSRSTVTEALQHLARQSVVEILPQRGTRVTPLRTADLLKSHFLREAIEQAALRRVCALTDRRALTEALAENLDAQRASLACDDKAEFYRIDNTFHDLFLIHAGLPQVREEIRALKRHFDRMRFLIVDRFAEDIGLLIAQHVAVAEAVASGDAARAEAAMQAHLVRIFEHLAAVAQVFPQFVADDEDGPFRVELQS